MKLTWSSSDQYYKDKIEAARNGDRPSAVLLLTEFSTLKEDGRDAHPVLVAYIAGLISDWVNTDFHPKDGASCFNVKRPPHRQSKDTTIKHQIDMLTAYKRARLRGDTKEKSIISTMEQHYRSESSVLQCVEAPSDIVDIVSQLRFTPKERELLAFKPGRPKKTEPKK